MVQFAQIVTIAEEVGIPKPIGAIIAEYTILTDIVRVQHMMDMYNGELKIDDNVCRNLMLYRSRITGLIHICDDFSIYTNESKWSPLNMAHMLRRRFWLPVVDPAMRNYTMRSMRDAWAAPLWQKIYDIWIAL